jgi:hypothetical protein
MAEKCPLKQAVEKVVVDWSHRKAVEELEALASADGCMVRGGVLVLERERQSVLRKMYALVKGVTL